MKAVNALALKRLLATVVAMVPTILVWSICRDMTADELRIVAVVVSGGFFCYLFDRLIDTRAAEEEIRQRTLRE
jgi:hypothetical protein